MKGTTKGIKIFVKKLVNKFGYDIRKCDTAGGLRTSMSECYELISRLGFKSETVIDVGVARGTYEF
jgi:hypothetical protein